jgi:tetratricopeptide (TPR) repeat protein
MADPMTSADSGAKTDKPVINARLGRLLGVVFLLFSLLVVNSVYLSAITLLEQSSNEIYQDYFYLLMFFVHLVLGLVLTVPVIIFAIGHMRRAWSRPNRYAIRAGFALFTGLMLVLLTGLLLTRFSFLEINDPLIRRISYWIHVISPFAVAWLFVLHRLAGPPIRWRGAVRWSFIAAGFAAVMILVHVGIRIWGDSESMTKFPPSLAVIEGSQTIPPDHLMTDEECKECHADIAASHETSMHHFSSFTNPPYKFSVREIRDVVYKRDGSMQASRFCAACHDPVPLFSGRFDDPAYDMENDPTAKAGITCATCHAITRVNSVLGNGDYTIVDPPSYPFAYSKSTLLKAINHQLIRAKPEFHKKTLLQPFHRSAEFCSLCHKVHIPKAVNHYRWLRGQDHYDSFLFSGVSGHRIDSFYYPEHAVDRCSHCHMALKPSDDPAARDFDDSGTRSVHLHQFPGANTAIAQLLDLPDHVMEAEQKRLRDVTRIDIFGIKEDGTIEGQLHAPLRPELPELVPGKRYLVEIVLRTTGVGHLLTQGTSDSNELWVDVTATAGDRVIGRSGSRNETGEVDPWSYFVNAYVLDKDGNRIDRRNAQDIFVALYNHQIPPGATAVVHYLLQVPENVRGPVRIEASLNYRKFDTTYMRYVQGDAFTRNDLPVTTMATDTIELPVAGQATGTAAQTPAVDAATRWNDYGIALLLEGGDNARGELRQAEQAFTQVESLQNPNGPLNLARVYFSEGRLEEAARALRRASNGEPPAPPWTIAWFSALIDRENGHLDEAIESLRNIIDNRFQSARERGFDFSYDIRVLNMMGRTLFERAREERGNARQATRDELLEKSRDWFLKTLVIDPEDLTAHYNLAQVYTELGETELAEQHRALHEKYRPDDHAIEQAVAKSRSTNPVANHAAAAIAIYDLNRPPADTGQTRQ